MPADAFTVLSEPTRRRILDQLRVRERSVGELVERLRLPQPTVSKHLKVLRDAGLVSSKTSAQQRIYRVEVSALRSLDAWLTPYRRLWSRQLDARENHLDVEESS